MNDKALQIAVRANILAGLSRHGLSDVSVVAANQPTNQGRVEGPTIYFFPLPESRYGWQHTKRKYDPATSEFKREERQWIESSFQVQCLSNDDPYSTTSMTAKDILNIVAMIIAGRDFIDEMRKLGVGLQRITAIRNPYFVNDHGEFEPAPSFDFTVSHLRAIIEQSKTAERITVSTHPI